MKLALIVGHSAEKKGAHNTKYKVYEYDFNLKFAERLKFELDKIAIGLETEIIFRDTYNNLPHKVNEHKPDFIISLHCNAFDQKASGSEVLYYHTSVMGKALAKALQQQITHALRLPDRGIKPLVRQDRGGYLLKNTLAPCVITEPFFIDNNRDLSRACKQMDNLISAYIHAISNYCKALTQ